MCPNFCYAFGNARLTKCMDHLVIQSRDGGHVGQIVLPQLSWEDI